MSSDLGHWERVASELRACREAQQQAWGDIGNATLGRYLAGDVTPEERRRVERALQALPELRKLTDLVGDVLRDCEPVPALLPFRRAAPAVKTRMQRWQRRVAVAAAAGLLLALGYVVLPKGGGRPAPAGGPVALAPAGNRIDAGVQRVVAMRPAQGAGAELGPPEAEKGAADAKETLDPAVLVADGLVNVGSAYEKRGDLDMAAFSYKVAYNVQEWRLGGDARPTVETRRNLGAVYQTALALADDEAKPPPAAPDLPAAAPLNRAKDMQVRNSALLLRQRITKQPVRDVRVSVVPVLVQNLREARTPEAREQLSLALAQLGPAAKDAVPVLEECLRKAETPRESAALLDALGEAGPSAAPAARTEILKMAADRPEWRGLKERLNGVEGRIGVRDGCEVLSIQALKQGQKEVRELARARHVEVYAETRPALPKDEEAKAEAERERDVADAGVYLVIHPSPLSVDAYVGPALRAEGLDAAGLRQAIEDASKRDLDEGLLAGVRFVERFAAEKAKKTPDKPG